MGEWLKQVPVKLDPETLARIDEDVKRFAPFCAGRSSMIRALVKIAYHQIDIGNVQLTLEGIQQALGMPGDSETRRVIPTTKRRK